MITAHSDIIKRHFPQLSYLKSTPAPAQLIATQPAVNLSATGQPTTAGPVGITIDKPVVATTNQAANFGINGFGRIGRTAFRVWWQYYRDQAQLKVINTSGSMELESWVHLIKYDSNYRQFATTIEINKTRSNKEVTDAQPELGSITLSAEGKKYQILVTAQKDPTKIPWAQYQVQTVIEATGKFVSQDKAAQHLQGGAKQVLISAPPKGGAISTSVIGVNDFDPQATVLSNASCTTNCVAPIAQIMTEKFGVKKAFLTTIHSYTDDQNLHDNSHADLRRARAAAMNIVPTSTGAAISTTEIIPSLKGLFDGLAIRIPTSVGSLSDFVFLVARPTTKEEVNQVISDAAKSARWQGIVAVVNEPIVSSDIIGRRESSIVDASLTNVIDGDLVKIISWYDNEWGYCCRLIEQVNRLPAKT